MGGFLKGVEIFANPFADMAIKEVIESCVSTRAGIALRSLESIGLPPEERLAYIYDWKTLTLDFGLGTLVGIGVGSAGIAFKGAAGDAVERAVKEGMEDTLEGAGDAAARVAKESAEEITERGTKEIIEVPSYADYMSPEDARRYLEFLENGSTAGLRPEELLGIQKVDDYLALSRVDYDEVLRLKNSVIESGQESVRQIPQGFTQEEFNDFAGNVILFAQRNNLPQGELMIHGSRVNGTATATSDIDIILRVDQSTFDAFAEQRLNTIPKGTRLYKTIVKAIKKQKLSIFDISKDFGRNLYNDLVPLSPIKEIDFSIILEGSPFDKGPFIDIK